MSSYKDYKKKVLQNPEIKSEYDALQPEYDIIQAMIDADYNKTSPKKIYLPEPALRRLISARIENGTRNPSLSMVKKLARGLGMQLKLEFIRLLLSNNLSVTFQNNL